MRDVCMNTSSFEFWMQRVHQLVWTRLSAGEWCVDECNSCLIAQLMSLHIRNWTLFWLILNFMSMCICLRCSLRGAVWVVLLMHKWFLWSPVNGSEAMRHFCHFFCCMTELSPFPPMWRTHGDHLRVLILRELGKGIIVVSWLWGCQCNFGGWHASNICDCAMLVNQSLRAEAENGPDHFPFSAELMSCWLPQTPSPMRVSWEGARVADIDKPENWVRISHIPLLFRHNMFC